MRANPRVKKAYTCVYPSAIFFLYFLSYLNHYIVKTLSKDGNMETAVSVSAVRNLKAVIRRKSENMYK